MANITQVESIFTLSTPGIVNICKIVYTGVVYYIYSNREYMKVSLLADDFWKPIIEPASPEEAAMIDERMKDYEKDPSSFVPFKKRKKG